MAITFRIQGFSQNEYIWRLMQDFYVKLFSKSLQLIRRRILLQRGSGFHVIFGQKYASYLSLRLLSKCQTLSKASSCTCRRWALTYYSRSPDSARCQSGMFQAPSHLIGMLPLYLEMLSPPPLANE